jgi:hypothetical protein
MRVTANVQHVSYNMDVTQPDLRAGVFLKTDHFALVTKLLDLTSDAAIGRAIGMDRLTIGRARDGIIGERFIAAVLSTFGQHADTLSELGVGVQFEDLFQIGEKS